MRLLFVNQHYWPDIAPTGQFMTDLAESLVARGHEVEVLCGRGGYTQSIDVPPCDVRRGVQIRRARTGGAGTGAALGRLAGYASFFAQALWRLAAGRDYDLAVVLTTPPLLSVAAAVARRLRGRHYVVWSMDLHPEAEVAAGMLADGSPVARILGALADEGYRHADAVVVLGGTMRERLLDRGVSADRVHTIGVWSDSRRVAPIESSRSALRARLGLGDRVVVMYAGNAGVVHRFDEVLKAICLLRDDDRFVFLFVGGGTQRAAIERAIAEMPPGRAAYLDYVSADELADSLGTGDIHLVTLREEMAGVALPSKVFGIMAAGRPTVFVGPGRSEVAHLLEASQAGVVVDPREGRGGERVAEVLRSLADDEVARHAMGARARAAFLAEHDCSVLCERWADLLDRCVDGPRQTPGEVPQGVGAFPGINDGTGL